MRLTLSCQNPLGAARGRYKVVQVFFTLCEVEKAQRSQIDRLTLCMVFREKLLKKYSLNTIYKSLVDDLKVLETGIQIYFPIPRTVKCGVLCYAADNLEVGFKIAHSFTKIQSVLLAMINQLVSQLLASKA